MGCFRKKKGRATITPGSARLTQDPIIPPGSEVEPARLTQDPIIPPGSEVDPARLTQDPIIPPGSEVEIQRPSGDSNVGGARLSRRQGIASPPVIVNTGEKLSKLLNVPKSDDEAEIIEQALKKNEFLSNILTENDIKRIVNSMSLRYVKANEIIIRQGDKGSALYISSEGTYQVIVSGKTVDEFNDNRVFGELAIIYDAKRLSTIKASTDGAIWCLDRKTFKLIITHTNLTKEEELFNFLQKVTKLNSTGPETLKVVANLLKNVFFESGKKIIKEGDPGDLFYIIKAGSVTISKKNEGIVGTIGQTDCFGELALQNEDIRQATVTANPPGVECLTLNRSDFQNHFGDIKITEIDVQKAKSIHEVQPEYLDLHLSDFRILGVLGVGGFARVELVQHKKKKDFVFALKRMAKANIVEEEKQAHAFNEKYIQMNSISPFIPRLYRTYKSMKYVYFLMEPCLGGDLFTLLHNQKENKFKDEHARFVIGCVIEALSYLHARGIIFRDLKPENVLLDQDGYFKLADFGFAKKLDLHGSKTYTFVGTPEYTSPEVIMGRGHNKAVDYWALGILIFELLVGKTPFYSGDPTYYKTFAKIQKGLEFVKFPSDVHNDAKKIILKLCKSNPYDRLGMSKDGINKIKKDKWFRDFEWDKLADRKLASPFKPNLKSPTDLSYIPNAHRQSRAKTNPPDEMSGWDRDF